MARANRASYKTCFVFRLENYEKKGEVLFLNNDGEWVSAKDNLQNLVKCFDKESADTIKEFIEQALDKTIIVQETVCDIVQELQLYSFVEAFVQDLRRARI